MMFTVFFGVLLFINSVRLFGYYALNIKFHSNDTWDLVVDVLKDLKGGK